MKSSSLWKKIPLDYPAPNNPENMHTSNILQAEQVIVRNIYIYEITVNEKETMILKESKEEHMGGF